MANDPVLITYAVKRRRSGRGFTSMSAKSSSASGRAAKPAPQTARGAWRMPFGLFLERGAERIEEVAGALFA